MNGVQTVGPLGKIDTKKWMSGVRACSRGWEGRHFYSLVSTLQEMGSRERELGRCAYCTSIPAGITFTIGKRDDLKTHEHGLCQWIRVESSENV
jgi:hypothetical protein